MAGTLNNPKRNPRQGFFLGFAAGLALPFITLRIAFLLKPELLGVARVGGEYLVQLNSQLITVGVLVNAVLFFLLLRLNREQAARGILSGSILLFVGVLVYRYLWPT